MFLDELVARFYLVTHQDAEQLSETDLISRVPGQATASWRATPIVASDRGKNNFGILRSCSRQERGGELDNPCFGERVDHGVSSSCSSCGRSSASSRLPVCHQFQLVGRWSNNSSLPAGFSRLTKNGFNHVSG